MSGTKRAPVLISFIVVLTALGAGGVRGAEAQQTQKPASEVTATTDSLVLNTNRGYVACTTREKLIEFTTHVANEETEKHSSMVRDPKSGCFLLKEGVPVVPIGYNDYFVELRPVGMKGTIFTLREAVTLKDPIDE